VEGGGAGQDLNGGKVLPRQPLFRLAASSPHSRLGSGRVGCGLDRDDTEPCELGVDLSGAVLAALRQVHVPLSLESGSPVGVRHQKVGVTRPVPPMTAVDAG